MWSRQLMGTDMYHIIHWFFVYSILGWLIESIYMSICNRKITNRGFIRGPICPIYGVGALTVYFILKPYSGNYILLYFYGAFLATALEYLTAKLMIRVFGEVWWDYHNKPFNYKGILCLESTVAWGFYTVFMFGFLQKFVEAIVNGYSVHAGIRIGTIVIVYFILDFTFSMLEAKLERMPKSMSELQETIKAVIYRN
ncbi:putative ABC transporter permease [Konateibacter massiliensis]|uniref:putative ABC transporter permease n=1 Tax=Konateibacter massiliensis TaxID=2002841 RepID=UPI000C14532C|nr:putative ABC transporter permease [Konateibacter massiliensis]